MQLELKDVLHHYLGCVIQTPEGLGNFIAMYARGDMPVVCDNTVQSDWNVQDVKPVLWPLENLTHEQRNEISKRYMDSVGSHHSAAAWFKMVRNDANTLIYLLKRHYDVFGLIARGLAVDASTLSSNPYAVQKPSPNLSHGERDLGETQGMPDADKFAETKDWDRERGVPVNDVHTGDATAPRMEAESPQRSEDL